MNDIFHQTRVNNPKIYMEQKKKKKKKELLLKPEEKEQSWRHKTWLQMIWQSYSNQNSESELPSQAATVFAWSSRKHVILCSTDERQCIFFWLILDAFHQVLPSVGLIDLLQ